MTRRALTMLAAVLLESLIAGCSSPTVAPEFTKPGVSGQTADRDAYECERDARMIRQNSCAEIRMYTSCMISKGYSLQPGSGRGC